MLQIVVVGGPAEGYVKTCLQSLVEQTVTDWRACVVLDPVGDRTVEDACSIKDSRINVIENAERQFALKNTCDAVDLLDPAPDDIIVSVDADDWLARRDSLEVVKSAYNADPKILLTYGSWMSYPNAGANTNTKEGYTQADFDKGIRKVYWRGSHLKTFKHKLWSRVDREHFKDPRGGYFRVAWDLAFMWPMLEMAGYSRTKWIKDRIYVYNQETPNNDAKLYLRQQMFFTNYMAAMPPYKLVEEDL